MNIKPIGIIRSEISSPEDAPIQPAGAKGIQGKIILNEELQEGLNDLEGFSHLFLLYHFHLATKELLTVTPFMDRNPRGVFSTRSPLRPNHIGLSIVKLIKVEGSIIDVSDIDIVDNTPLLDIKPYIHNFDTIEKSTSGWMKATKEQVETKRSDDRFM